MIERVVFVVESGEVLLLPEIPILPRSIASGVIPKKRDVRSRYQKSRFDILSQRLYTLFFISNARLKLAKNQANANTLRLKF